MTDRELMQQALDALESVTGHFTRTPSTLRDSEVRGEAHKAITALREALAHPEQELVIDCPRCGHCCPQQPVQEPVTWKDKTYEQLKEKNHD